MKKVNKYLYNFKLSIKNFTLYKSNYLIRILFFLFITYIMYNLWREIYQSNNLSIIEFNQLIWYLLFTRALSMNLSSINTEITNDIKTGNISLYINKPYNYIIFKFWGSLGDIAIPAAINISLTLIMGMILTGSLFYNISLFGMLLSLLILLNGVILDWLIKFSLSQLSFWIEETKGVFIVYNRLLLLLGGVMLPVDIFPEWLLNISKWLPPNFIINSVSKLIIDFSFTAFINLFIKQMGYTISIAIVSIIVYRKGVKKINVNGG